MAEFLSRRDCVTVLLSFIALASIASALGMTDTGPVVRPQHPLMTTPEPEDDAFYYYVGVYAQWTVLGLEVAFIIWQSYDLYKQEQASKKRYLETVDPMKLPRNGDRAGFLGVVAETEFTAYMDIDKLTMHTLIAGASGSGKTVAAQVLIEEALVRGVSVLLFDPTAQWTGFLRPQKNPKMLSLYSRFGMRRSQARAFPGNIVYVENPNVAIDLKKCIKPGEVTIFVLTKLSLAAKDGEKGKLNPSSPMETFISNTIQRIFEANFDESPKLRILMVYDEVHRLLPKFGGSGAGFLQIERGAREFRKWGIGLILISQVLSDFVGDIKANIGTEIQMRTKYEGDLERIRMKFGDDALKNSVRSPVGTGMVHNAEYNNGSPYFVTFRPLLHDVVRLSDQELDKYKKYNARIDELAKRVARLSAAGQDVFDLELSLDLAREKLKKGSFTLVDVYLEDVAQSSLSLCARLDIQA